MEAFFSSLLELSETVRPRSSYTADAMTQLIDYTKRSLPWKAPEVWHHVLNEMMESLCNICHRNGFVAESESLVPLWKNFEASVEWKLR
nr:hypothetical protein TetV2_00577 [Oceanusvirus sp.]